MDSYFKRRFPRFQKYPDWVFLRKEVWLFYLILAAEPAAAQNWYLGIGLGRGEVEVVGHDRSTVAEKLALGFVTGGENDNIDTRHFVTGYRFSRHWSAELGFFDLGNTRGSYEAAMPVVVNGSIMSKYRALVVNANGRWPVAETVSIFARLGLNGWRHEIRFVADGNITSESDSGAGLYYGIGIEYSPVRDWSINFGWSRFDNVENQEGIDVKAFTLNYLF